MTSSPCLSPPISPRTSPPTTTASGHQLSRKHSRQECSAPLPCLNRVHSTPSSYRPKAWRARASRECRSVRDAHRHSEASSQSPYHRPAPQPKLPFVIPDLHFDPPRHCVPERIAQCLPCNPVDLVSQNRMEVPRRPFHPHMKLGSIRVRSAAREFFSQSVDRQREVVGHHRR